MTPISQAYKVLEQVMNDTIKNSKHTLLKDEDYHKLILKESDFDYILYDLPRARFIGTFSELYEYSVVSVDNGVLRLGGLHDTDRKIVTMNLDTLDFLDITALYDYIIDNYTIELEI